ncbi:hypothetical protein V9T40_002911 [Parthenolecanium corni]|uniref:Osiris 7 n=1 Tax=Parthenolecanium corni TaxID=536013 RepID=A0AAN9TGZ9_9HEMI
MCRIVRIWFEMDLVIDVNLTLKPVLKLGIGHYYNFNFSTMHRNSFYFVFVAVLCNFHNSESLPSPALDVPASGFHTTNSIESKQDFLESVYTDCTDNKGSVPCFKYKLFAFVDKILNKDEINLANGITVVRTAVSGVDGAPRSMDKVTESEAQNTDVATMLMKRVERFLSTHTLKVDLRGSDVLNAVSRAGRTLEELSDGSDDEVEEEGRGKKKGGGKKGGKMMGHLLMMIKMKLLGLIPLAFGLIALLAGKALLIGKLALLLSVIIALKKLVSSHQKTVTYEVVAGHPHSAGGHDSYSSGGASDYSYGGGGGGGSSHGGWGRSADAHDLAYKAYKPTSQKAD